ncbi:FkbM family methyltransferase [Crocinitomix algicola]|uniref:FkbM family methyltransferase n=1 Tax=Crocinitomix algicola TaxID=1740263 RepID=UPI00087267B9|nr:FkbM family methyltransferase [Crocinitomix algicola]
MIKRVLNKLGIYKEYKIQLNQQAFKIPVFHGMGLNNLGENEPWMSALLKAFGSENTRFLDVGVNIGQTLLKWKSIYPNANYIGFEPNPNCINYLERLISANQFEAKIYPYGIDVSPDIKELFVLPNDKTDSSASMIHSFRPGENRQSISIETISLKELELQEFDLVKIDVEGAELMVLKSLFEICTDATIICEILPAYTKENKERLARQEEIEKLLQQFNYDIYRIIKHPKLQLHKLDSIGINPDINSSDYVFIPSSKRTNYLNFVR